MLPLKQKTQWQASGRRWILILFILCFESAICSEVKEKILTKDSEVVVSNIRFTFYGRSCRQLIMCGPSSFIAFEDLNKACLYSSQLMKRFPNEATTDRDIMALAVFTSDTSAGSYIQPDLGPKFAYTVYKNGEQDPDGIITKVADAVTSALQPLNSQTSGFRWEPTTVVKFHWKRVLSIPCKDDSSCLHNAYQVLIAIKDQETVAIYNYENMNWNPSKKLQMGFNAGNNFDWTNFTRPSDFNQMSTFGRIPGELGQYMYMISSSPPIRLGCLNTTSGTHPLMAHPPNSTMLGGEVLTLGGPCLTSSSAYVCSFMTQSSSEGIDVDASMVNAFYLRCQVPILMTTGQVLLRVKSKDGKTGAIFETFLDVVRPDQIEPKVNLVDPDLWAHRYFPTQKPGLDISWSQSTFQATRIRLDVRGYSEAAELSQTERFKVMKSVQIDNSGQFTLTSNDMSCDDINVCLHHHIGFLSLTGSYDGKVNRTVWSRLMPMGWFVNAAMTQKKGEAWPDAICNSFEVTPPNIQWASVSCPCTLKQAEINFHDFIPTSECPTLPGGCVSAKPLQTCFRTGLPRAHGDKFLAALCCYSNETGLLLHAENVQFNEKSNHGSRGALLEPSTDIPQFSFFYRETLQFFYCCLWRKDVSFCPYYNQRRPTPSCRSYRSGSLSAVLGDPHFVTFGNERFTVNVESDYKLLDSKNIDIHGRFSRSKLIKHATMLKAVAFKVGTSTPITIFHTGSSPSIRECMRQWFRVIRKNGEIINMDTGEHQEEGVLIKENIGKLSLQVLLTHETDSVGFVLRRNPQHDYMNIEVSVSSSLQAATVGLLGKWQANENISSIVSCDGTSFSNLDVAKHDSGISNLTETCRIKSEDEGLFWYRSPWKLKQITYKDLVPARVTDVPNSEIPPSCEGQQFCAFDKAVFDDQTVWENTLQAIKRYDAYRAGLKEVHSCGRPYIVNGIFNGNDYSENSEVEVIGCQNEERYSLSKKQLMICHASSDGTYKWNPSPLGIECVDKNEGDGFKTGTIIISVIVIVILFLVMGLVACYLMRKKPKRDKPDGKRNHFSLNEKQDKILSHSGTPASIEDKIIRPTHYTAGENEDQYAFPQVRGRSGIPSAQEDDDYPEDYKPPPISQHSFGESSQSPPETPNESVKLIPQTQQQQPLPQHQPRYQQPQNPQQYPQNPQRYPQNPQQRYPQNPQQRYSQNPQQRHSQNPQQQRPNYQQRYPQNPQQRPQNPQQQRPNYQQQYPQNPQQRPHNPQQHYLKGNAHQQGTSLPRDHDYQRKTGSGDRRSLGRSSGHYVSAEAEV